MEDGSDADTKERSPHLIVIYVDSIPEEVIGEFLRDVSSDGLVLLSEEDSSDRVYAGIDLLLPTALFIFITKSYFDGFLSEMGRDHYNILKNCIERVIQKMANYNVTLVGSQGKVSDDREFSLMYSIYFERMGGGRFKILIQEDQSPESISEIVDASMQYIQSYYGETMDDRSLLRLRSATPIGGGTVLLLYNKESKDFHALTLDEIIPRRSR